MPCLCQACLSPEEKRKAMEGWPDDAKRTMTKVAKIIVDAINAAPCPSCAAKDARIRELEERDETWREKKAMLENDLGKAWKKIAALEKVAEAGEGASRIVAERARQKSVEGWTPEHDEQHGFGELFIAAACYALNCRKEDGSPIEGDAVVHDRDCHDGWPWSRKWDKRGKHSRERSLEIAGALIAAELDRIAALREVGK